MRLRALPLLLVLTAADYALWDWSIAGGHDVISLIAGLTLLPLAAATLALLAIGAAWLSGRLLERAGGARPAARAGARADTRARARRGMPAQDLETPPHAAAAKRTSERDSRRLAA